MKKLLFFTVLLSGSLLLAQDAAPVDNQRPNNSSGLITVRGCVSRANGDYVLMKENPPDTYELQAAGKTS
jgi:hypothetical protein